MNSPNLGMVGNLSKAVIDTLGLAIDVDTPVYIGQTNLDHMQNRHPLDFVKYSSYIHDIVQTPDYVGINPNDSSIELVKEFAINSEYVKVAVRVTNNGKLFARSLYVLNPSRVRNFIAKGHLKPLTKAVV